MSQNMLVDRLKAAKRELTALKTAHQRGLNNLRVYTKDQDVPYSGHEQGIWDLNITIKFDTSFPSFPFAYILPARLSGSGIFATVLEQATAQYIDGGYGMKIGTAYYYSPEDNSFSIVSTAPVTSVSFEWSN